MRKQNIKIVFLSLMVISIYSCDKWDFEKREDHDINSFEKNFQVFNGVKKVSAAILTDDNHIVCVGTSINTINGSEDIFLNKIDESGNSLWLKSNEIWYYTTQKDYEEIGMSVIQTQDKGYAVVGSRNISGKGLQLYLIKTDAEGVFEWEKNFGGDDNDEGYSLVQKEDGGYLLLGYTKSYDVLNKKTEPIIYETDENGNELAYFVGNLGTNNDDYGYKIIRTSDNKYVLFINSYEHDSSSVLNMVDLTHELSNTPTLKLVLQNSSDQIVSVFQNNKGSFVLTTVTRNSPALKLIITNENEQAPIIKTYTGIDAEDGASVCQTQDGGYALLSSDMTLVKTNDSGTELWRANLEGISYGNQNIIQASDGGFFVVGQNTESEISVIKTDPLGNIR